MRLEYEYERNDRIRREDAADRRKEQFLRHGGVDPVRPPRPEPTAWDNWNSVFDALCEEMKNRMDLHPSARIRRIYDWLQHNPEPKRGA